MFNEKLVDKIVLYGKGNSFSIKHTLKFQSNDFEFEIVESPYKPIYDENNKFIIGRENNTQPGYLYVPYDESSQYMKIKGSEDDFIQKGTTTYRNAKFNYCIYRIDEFDFAVLKNFSTKDSEIEIPDDVDGIPVVGVHLDYYINPDLIEKITIGNNLLYNVNFSKYVHSLKKVVVKNGYRGTGDALSSMLITFINGSSFPIDFQIEEGSNFKLINKCLVSNDEKDLFLILERDCIDIPKKVEHIHARAFLSNAKVTSVIKWPEKLKVIDDLTLNKTTFSKLLARNPLPKKLEVLNGCVVENFVKDYVLYIPKSIKKIYPSFIERISNVNSVVIDSENKDFIFEKKLLLTKDKKTLILCLDRQNKKVLCLPESIENIQDKAFSFSTAIKIILLKRKNENLIKQIENYNITNRRDIKVEVLNCNEEVKSSPDSISTQTKYDTTPKYGINKNKCFITNNVSLDVLKVDISNFSDTKTKTFVLTKECAHIKELILSEGVTDIEIDSSCYSVDFELEILEIPSSCKFMSKLEELDSINSLMLVIIQPDKKPRWTVHKLSYVVACKNSFTMPEGVFSDYNSYYGNGNFDYSVINEITYLNNFNRDKLIISDEAYYYIKNKSKKEVSLLKAKNLPGFVVPKKVDIYNITNKYNFWYSKLDGYGIEDNEKENLEISSNSSEIDLLKEIEKIKITSNNCVDIYEGYKEGDFSESSNSILEKIQILLKFAKENLEPNTFDVEITPLAFSCYIDNYKTFYAFNDNLLQIIVWKNKITALIDFDEELFKGVDSEEIKNIVESIFLFSLFDVIRFGDSYQISLTFDNNNKLYIKINVLLDYINILCDEIINKYFPEHKDKTYADYLKEETDNVENNNDEDCHLVRTDIKIKSGVSYSPFDLFTEESLEKMQQKYEQNKKEEIEVPSFGDLKILLNFISNNNVICNVEFNFYDQQIPVFIEMYPDENSIYATLLEALKDKSYVSEVLKDNFDINLYEFNQLHEIEKALVIFTLLYQSCKEYSYNISYPSESKKYLKELVGKSKVIDKFFEGMYDEENSIIVNIVPIMYKNAVTDSSLSVNFNVDSLEISLDELFTYAKGDLDDDKIKGYNMFLYHFDNEQEAEEMYNDQFAGTLTYDELSYLGEKIEECKVDIVQINNETELLTWIIEGHDINIFEYKNNTLVHKLPSYLLYCNESEGLKEILIYNDYFFDKENCPTITISLKECFEQETSNDFNKQKNVEKDDNKEDVKEVVLKEEIKVKEQIDQPKTKRNTGYTAKNDAILKAPDFVTALDLATNSFSGNHSEEDAIKYSKKMELALLYENAIYAKDEHGNSVSATFNRKNGIQISCYCDEYKTKSNPCVHCRALYYLLKDNVLIKNNENKEETLVDNNANQPIKKKNKGYTVKNDKVLACSDLVSAIDLATKDFSKKHDENEAIEYSKQMEITLHTKNNVRARNKDKMFTTVNFTKARGIEFTCECDEYKTKTNPCVHIRALYYLLNDKTNKTNNVEEINNIENEKKVEEIVKSIEKLDNLEQENLYFEKTTTGTDINKILPPVSRFGGGNRGQKKQTVLQKIIIFFKKFFGL